jgi:hypothetical protein
MKLFLSVFALLLLMQFDRNESNAQRVNDSKKAPWIDSRLQEAGENSIELKKALDEIEVEFRPGLDFLISNMPESDLKSLDADFLLEHVRGAYLAWQKSPWHSQVSQEAFFNHILPYCSVSEKRDRWRNDFRKRFLPMVENAKSPSEAAVILNQKIFPTLDVKYSTKRKRADQSPYESIEGKTASCTGLSILLIDACRSVGVPARFVGTPRWSDDSGNHSWVEIWDGDWKFTGAAEPTGDELNKGWFVERASKADATKAAYAIYAVSFKKTNLKFPMVWQRDFDPVWATNVTQRYTAKKQELSKDQVLMRFKAVDVTGERFATPITISADDGEVVYEGVTKDESFDANDHLSVALKKDETFLIAWESSTGERKSRSFSTNDGMDSLIVLNAKR